MRLALTPLCRRRDLLPRLLGSPVDQSGDGPCPHIARLSHLSIDALRAPGSPEGNTPHFCCTSGGTFGDRNNAYVSARRGAGSAGPIGERKGRAAHHAAYHPLVA
jgi:hypothetical protein